MDIQITTRTQDPVSHFAALWGLKKKKIKGDTYAVRGCWKLFLKNSLNNLKQPHRVFWHKDNYYNWDECKKRGANMGAIDMLHERSVMYPGSNIITRLRNNNNVTPFDLNWLFTHIEPYERVWKVQTIYGSKFIHMGKNMIGKKEILAEIRKRRRRMIGLIVTRKIGTLGFEVGSYI